MTIVKQLEAQDNIHLSSQKTKANLKVREIWQVRCAKMHVSRLIKDIDNKNALTPALRELLEASFILQTTSAKILAAHLHYPPATIRAEFQQILAILGNHGRNLASRTTKYEDSLFIGVVE